MVIDARQCSAEYLWSFAPRSEETHSKAIERIFGLPPKELFRIRLERETERMSVDRAISEGKYWTRGMALSNLAPGVRDRIKQN